jgi:hypothetical protein
VRHVRQPAVAGFCGLLAVAFLCGLLAAWAVVEAGQTWPGSAVPGAAVPPANPARTGAPAPTATRAVPNQRSDPADPVTNRAAPRIDHRYMSTRPAFAPGSGAGGPSVPSSADIADRTRVGPPAGYSQSLIYSGLLGLVISLTGLGMVLVRRRAW